MSTEMDTENMQFLSDTKEYSNEFEECKPLTDFLINNFGNELFDLPDNLMDETPIVINENSKPKSKFAKKLEEANLRINLTNNNVIPQNKMPDLNSAIMANDELNNLITPSIEKTFSQLIQSIPTCELLDTDNEALELFCLDQTIAKTDELLGDELEDSHQSISSAVPIDHAYVKQKEFLLSDELTNDSFISSSTDKTPCYPSTSDSVVSSKKKRPRGVYRKDDIRNEEDLENYLHRRRKNNLSSKMSRANKKQAYQEIDSKIDFLFVSNKKLTSKIAKLENINKIIKDMLVDKLAKSSKSP